MKNDSAAQVPNAQATRQTCASKRYKERLYDCISGKQAVLLSIDRGLMSIDKGLLSVSAILLSIYEKLLSINERLLSIKKGLRSV